MEEEFTFQAPTDPGVNTLKVYFSEVGDGSDINRAQPLDEWSYRVSRYRNSIEHLNPSEGHPSRAFGPFGAMHIATPPAPPLPAGFDFPGSPAAQLRSGWALPSFVRSLSDLADPQSGLGFLRLAHWSGLLDAPDTVATDGLFWRPRAPDLNVLLDLALMPIGLVLRTGEPCDWRRVDATLVVGDFTGDHRRFSIRLSPSPDGCACILLATAEDVPIRLPRGNLALQVQFHLQRAGLPRLTRIDDPDRTSEVFSLTFHQTFGTAW